MNKLFWLWPVFALVTAMTTGNFFWFWFSVVGVAIVALSKIVTALFGKTESTPNTVVKAPAPPTKPPSALPKVGQPVIGTPEISAPSMQRFCGSCGKPVDSNTRFCGACGSARA